MTFPQMARLPILVTLLCAMLLLRAGEPASSPIAQPKTDTIKMVGSDREALKKLFDQMAQAFLKNDPEECLKLFAPAAAERNKLTENIRDEFLQSKYERFEIAEVRTDEMEQDLDRKHVYAVDVVLRMATRSRKADEANGNDPERVYSTTYSFVVQRLNDGSFALRFSEFFKTLGLRRGPGILLHGIGIAIPIVGFCVALILYVWMGWEAWRERPRAKFWRYATIVPVAGSLAYLLIRLVPRWLNKT